VKLQSADNTPDAGTQTVTEAKRRTDGTDTGTDGPAPAKTPVATAPVTKAPPATVVAPPSGPARADVGGLLNQGQFTVGPADTPASGAGIDVRGQVSQANGGGGSGLGLDVRVVETVPKYFAFFPAKVSTCAPPAPALPITATTGVQAKFVNLVVAAGQTPPYPACETKPSYEPDTRYQIDFATRSSLSSLGELSTDLMVDRYRVLGRVANVPASMSGSIYLQRNQRLPWTDVKVALNGKEAFQNVAFEVFDSSQVAAVGPAVNHPQPVTGSPPGYKCDQVPGLCDRDPRPAPGGTTPAFPDPANQVPNYRLGFANVTNRLTVVGQLRDSETSRFGSLTYSDTSACPTSSYRPGGQHLGYAHLDLDLKGQATSVTLTKRDGIDPSVTPESLGVDLAPGSGNPASKYTLGTTPGSTGITVRTDKPVNGSLRVRMDNVQVNRESDHDYPLDNHVNLGICVDLDLPFELAMYGVTDVRFSSSGAEFGIDLSKADLDRGALANFYIHERVGGGDVQGAQYAYRKTGIDFSWGTSGPGDDLNEEQSGPFTKTVRLEPNAPLCQMPHYRLDQNQYVLDKMMISMCYQPGASSGGDNPGWNQANMVSANNSWTRPMADIGSYRRLSFMADLLFSDSFLNGLVEHDSYGPVDPIGPGNIIFRNVASLGVLPMDFRMPSLTSTPVQSSGVTEHANVNARAADGTTYAESDNVEFFTAPNQGNFEIGAGDTQALVARYPNGQIRWVHWPLRRVALFAPSAFSLTVNPDGSIKGWSGYSSVPSPPQGYTESGWVLLDASGTKLHDNFG
jgi:hypothetical protein